MLSLRINSRCQSVGIVCARIRRFEIFNGKSAKQTGDVEIKRPEGSQAASTRSSGAPVSCVGKLCVNERLICEVETTRKMLVTHF